MGLVPTPRPEARRGGDDLAGGGKMARARLGLRGSRRLAHHTRGDPDGTRDLAVTHALNDAKSRVGMNTTIRPLEQTRADLTEDGLLTPREAAQLLRVSVETLRAMPVPYLTIGAGHKRPRRRYVRQHVLDWCKRRAMP